MRDCFPSSTRCLGRTRSRIIFRRRSASMMPRCQRLCLPSSVTRFGVDRRRSQSRIMRRRARTRTRRAPSFLDRLSCRRSSTARRRCESKRAVARGGCSQRRRATSTTRRVRTGVAGVEQSPRELEDPQGCRSPWVIPSHATHRGEPLRIPKRLHGDAQALPGPAQR